MTLEAGAAAPYRRRVAEHLLAAKPIIATVARHRAALLRAWARSVAQAKGQGARGVLQGRPGTRVYGYALGAGGAAAPLVRLLLTEGVRVRQLRAPVRVEGLHPYGTSASVAATLPAGTYFVLSAQSLKHWV